MRYWVEHFSQQEYAKFQEKQDAQSRMTAIEATSAEEALQKAQQKFPNHIIKKVIPSKKGAK